MSNPGTARTGGQDGRARRTVNRDDLLAQRQRLLAYPPSPERSVELRRIRSRIQNLEYRSPRYGD